MVVALLHAHGGCISTCHGGCLHVMVVVNFTCPGGCIFTCHGGLSLHVNGCICVKILHVMAVLNLFHGMVVFDIGHMILECHYVFSMGRWLWLLHAMVLWWFMCIFCQFIW